MKFTTEEDDSDDGEDAPRPEAFSVEGREARTFSVEWGALGWGPGVGWESEFLMSGMAQWFWGSFRALWRVFEQIVEWFWSARRVNGQHCNKHNKR